MFKEGILLAIITVLVIIAAVAGIFSRDGDMRIESESLRGQPVVYQGSGIYKYNPAFFVREGIIWDTVNLFIALPLFVFASVAALRNSLRGRLLLGGLLAYFFYVYLSCVMMYAFNKLFLIYIAIYSLSIVAFIQNIRKVNIQNIPAHMSTRFPHGLFIGFTFALAAALSVLWIMRIVPIMRTGMMPEEYAGLNTLGSQALDLGLLVPLSIGTGILLIRRSAWGYHLYSVAMAIGLMMFISIPSWITVPLIQDGKTNILEAVPFYIISVVGIALAVIFYLNIKPGVVSHFNSKKT